MSVAPSRFTKGVAVGSSRWAVRLVGTSLGLFLSVGAVSAAEDPPGSERTESAFSVLYERALVAYQAGHYADAIEALLVAYKLRPEPRLLYNIAQAHRKLGNLRKSREYFEQYLAADREIATDMKAEVQHQITELTAQERAAAPPPPQTPAQAPAQTPVQTPAQTPVLLPPKLAIVDSSHASRGPAPYQVQRWHKAGGRGAPRRRGRAPDHRHHLPRSGRPLHRAGSAPGRAVRSLVSAVDPGSRADGAGRRAPPRRRADPGDSRRASGSRQDRRAFRERAGSLIHDTTDLVRSPGPREKDPAGAASPGVPNGAWVCAAWYASARWSERSSRLVSPLREGVCSSGSCGPEVRVLHPLRSAAPT